MSVRERIADNIVTVLGTMDRPTLKKVTRDPFELNDLSVQQFPAVWIGVESASDNDATMGGSALTRFSETDFTLVGYMKGSSTHGLISEVAEEFYLTEASETLTTEYGSYDIDHVRDEMIEGIAEKLDADRTRGGFAKNTEIISVEDDDSVFYPYGAVRVTARVTYHYVTGTT